MEKLLPVLLSASLLTACGGSGGGSSPQPSTPAPAPTPAPVPAPNEAPTISGTFTLNAKAAQSNKIVFNTADKENDQLSFSIANKPDWVSFNLTDNQLELDFQPGFFDIDDYQLKFRISDGKDATEYDFNLVVEDNRDQWQEIDMTEAETVGIWSNTAEDIRFVFLENKTGVYSNKGENKSVSWFTPDTIDMQVYDFGCFQNGCPQQDFFEISVVAREQDRIRVSILNNDDTETVLNLTKEEASENPSRYYVSLAQVDAQSASTFDGNTANIRLFSPEISIGSATYSALNFAINTEIKFENGKYVSVSNEPIVIGDNLNGGFLNQVTNEFISLNFRALASQYSSTVFKSGLLVNIADMRLELTSDISPYDISDFQGLSDVVLEYKLSSIQLNAPKLTSEIQLKHGKSYTGRIITSDRIIDGTSYLAGGSTFKIINDTQAETQLNVAGLNSQETVDFKWRIDNNAFVTTIDNVEKSYEFVALPNNSIGLSNTYTLGNGNKVTDIFSFVELPENSFTEQDYIGNFLYSTSNSFQGENRFLTLTSNNLARTDAAANQGFESYWKYENDDSVSIINRFQCDGATTYDECLSLVVNNSDRSLLVENFKLLSIDGANYKFKYSFFSRRSDGSQRAFESLRYFNKLAQ